MTTKTITPFKATHPGSVLKDELQTRKISQKEFARDIEMQPTMLNEIIKGKRAITAEIAIMLENALDIPADFWMRYQFQYELDCARGKEKLVQKTQQIEIWKLIKKLIPVFIFEKRGFLTSSLSENISIIWEIFEVKSVDELEESIETNVELAFYKKSEKLKNDQINIFAWSKLAQWQAKSEVVKPFHSQNRDSIVAELKSLFYRNLNVVAETKSILNRNGIKFLVIEKFKESPIDGYSFWSNDNPAIVLTLRKKNLDNFAFSVVHELGHIFEHLQPYQKEDFLDIEYPDSEHNEKEQEADRFAKQCFIGDSVWSDFVGQNKSFNYHTTENKIIQFANSLGIHPSIVLGRYCYETKQFAIKTKIDKTIN